MRRKPRIVVYIGTAQAAHQAVPCSSCYAEIGSACVWNVHTGKIPHQARLDLVEAIGLLDIAAAPLLDDMALQSAL